MIESVHFWQGLAAFLWLAGMFMGVCFYQSQNQKIHFLALMSWPLWMVVVFFVRLAHDARALRDWWRK